MTTPPERTPVERYADLADLLVESMGSDDPAPARLIRALDLALRPQPAPPRLTAALNQLLRQRLDAPAALVPSASPQSVPQQGVPQQGVPSHGPAALSRREALRVGAGGMALLLSLGNIGPNVARELLDLAQGKPMTGKRLVGILRAERDRWNALLKQVGVDRMEEPGVEGEWSVKELVAHLTWYERAVVEAAQQVARTGTFTRPRPEGMGMDEMNAQIAAESHSRSVEDVLAEADQVFTQLLGLINRVPDALLNDPHLLGLPDDIPPWMRVANNSYGHYREHEESLHAWLDKKRNEGAS